MESDRTNRWKKKAPIHRSPIAAISLLTLFFSLLFFVSYKRFASDSILLAISLNSQPPQCRALQALEEKFMWYAPHSGFGNQLSEFKNALLMAAILNRTLVVPPVLDHHAVALGSCPKFRVLSPDELRMSVWNHSMELFFNHRYLSMADIIDLSSLVSTLAVRVIDFRAFVSLFCGMSIEIACSSPECLTDCGSLLSGFNGNVDNCMYAVDKDCRTTVWTYKKDKENGVLDSFQPDEKLKNKKRVSFVRTRQDVYTALGPGSNAESATVLSFGSLFTAPYKGSELYIDIHEAPMDQRIQTLIRKIEYLPFLPEILEAGKEFVSKTIKKPFVCAQLRLLDGQFKNHRKATFLRLKERLEALKKNVPLPVHIFLMTDLPLDNWSGTYLDELVRDSGSVKLFFFKKENEDLAMETAKKLVGAGRGMKFVLVANGSDEGRSNRRPQLPDVRLYIEQTICSCASLGFVGTSGSTIAESIEVMRKHGACLNEGSS